jgi:hypothetical protein
VQAQGSSKVVLLGRDGHLLELTDHKRWYGSLSQPVAEYLVLRLCFLFSLLVRLHLAVYAKEVAEALQHVLRQSLVKASTTSTHHLGCGTRHAWPWRSCHWGRPLYWRRSLHRSQSLHRRRAMHGRRTL